jgi:hypothetical protein
MRSERFEAEVIEGHKGVIVALVPFDPAVAWRCPPVRLAGRRHGWPVRGTVNRVAFEGYVGERWGRFFVILDESLRKASGVATGDRVRVALAPTTSPGALAKAMEQSKVTTQPKKVRADAIDPTGP